MNLLTQAEADNAFILEDTETGFGRPMTWTNPVGPVVYEVAGQFQRVGVAVNDLGLLVAGDTCTATARLSRFPSSSLPREGWTVSATDSTGVTVTGKVKTSGHRYDRVAGRVTVELKVL